MKKRRRICVTTRSAWRLSAHSISHRSFMDPKMKRHSMHCVSSSLQRTMYSVPVRLPYSSLVCNRYAHLTSWLSIHSVHSLKFGNNSLELAPSNDEVFVFISKTNPPENQEIDCSGMGEMVVVVEEQQGTG